MKKLGWTAHLMTRMRSAGIKMMGKRFGLISIGQGVYVAATRINKVEAADNPVTKRIIKGTRTYNKLIDGTQGQKTRSIIVMDTGHVILSPKTTESLMRKEEKDE